MKFQSLSSLALATVLVLAPVAVFAEDSVSADGSASAEVTTETQMPSQGGEHSGQPEKRGMGFGIGLPSFFKGKLEGKAEGSSTMPGRPGLGLGMKGDMKNGSSTEKRDQKQEDRQNMLKGVGDTQIDNRIAKLQEALKRLQEATNLTDTIKATITQTLNDQITALTNLKSKIGTDTGTTTKEDVQSITKSMRVYAVVLPKAAITAAADRVTTLTTNMEALGAKVSARIEAAKTAGADVSAAETAYTDFTAKVADAKIQAQAAAVSVANLAADNGDKTVQESNTATLKAAQEKIKTAETDLKTARTDLTTILKSIAGKGEVKAEAGAQTSGSVSQ